MHQLWLGNHEEGRRMKKLMDWTGGSTPCCSCGEELFDLGEEFSLANGDIDLDTKAVSYRCPDCHTPLVLARYIAYYVTKQGE